MSKSDIKPCEYNLTLLVNLWFTTGMLTKIIFVVLKKHILMSSWNWEPLLYDTQQI